MDPSSIGILKDKQLGTHVIYVGSCHITTPTACPLWGAPESGYLRNCFEECDVDPFQHLNSEGRPVENIRDLCRKEGIVATIDRKKDHKVCIYTIDDACY